MKIANSCVIASILTGLVVLTAGCGGGDKKSKLVGVVTYNNSPVTGGNVTLSNEAGGSYSTPIQIDGNYTITDIPPGTYTVTVETETVNPDRKTPTYGGEKRGQSGAATAGKMEKMNKEYESKMKKGGEGESLSGGGFGPASKEELLKRYTKIPAKFNDKKLSGLSVEIGQGTVKKDFPLAD